MRIKQKYKNDYILSSNDHPIWVRNFTQQNYLPLDINRLFMSSDKLIILNNEMKNNSLQMQNIDDMNIKHTKCIIVSDGYNFEKKQDILMNLPKDVAVLVVNEALKKWNIKNNVTINYFIVNNPYKDSSLSQIPTKHRYFPMCIMSSRTYYEFPKRYKGYTVKYIPVQQEDYQTKFHQATAYQIDDYRNPVCAAINLAFHFGVQKLLLFCCDDVFEEKRPGAEKLKNDLWMYPPQRIAHDIIDANCYWLTHQDQPIEIKNHSSGPEYKNIEYISEDNIIGYFKDE